MEKDKGSGKGHYGQLAVALQQSLAARRGGGGGGDGDSDDDDWDMSEDDWSEDEEEEGEEEMGFDLFYAADEVSDVKAKPLAVGRYAAVQLADAKKPTITLNELNTIFTAQKEVRCILMTLFDLMK